MKKILLGICLLVTTNLVYSQLTPEQEKLYKDVLAISEKRSATLILGDYKDLGDFFDEHAIVILSHRKNKFNLKQFQESMAQKKIAYDTIYDLSVKPQFYNDNKICILTIERKVVYKYPTLIFNINVSEVFYLNDKNQWIIMYYHAQ